MALSSLFSPAPARRPRPRRLAFEPLDDRITPDCGMPHDCGCACPLPPSQVSGLVYVDQNANGVAEDTEPRLAGVTITLTGTAADGDSVTMTATTDAGGIYLFQNLEAGTYTIQATTPAGYTAGQSSVGAFGGTTGPNITTNVQIPQGQSSGGYNFGELVPPPNPCPCPCPCPPPPPCPPPDDDGPRPRGGNGNHFGWDKQKDKGDRPKGNNGVGNGVDPQPPGNPPINDGPGTSPGHPGNRGGAKK